MDIGILVTYSSFVSFWRLYPLITSYVGGEPFINFFIELLEMVVSIVICLFILVIKSVLALFLGLLRGLELSFIFLESKAFVSLIFTVDFLSLISHVWGLQSLSFVFVLPCFVLTLNLIVFFFWGARLRIRRLTELCFPFVFNAMSFPQSTAFAAF